MSTTEFIAHVRIEGFIEDDLSEEEIHALLEERVVMYFPDDEPNLPDSLIGIAEVTYIKRTVS